MCIRDSYETELFHDTEACFTLTAINDYGSESDFSNVECGTGNFTPPALSLNISDSTAILNWGSVISAESYKVYQGDSFFVEVSAISYEVDIETDETTCFSVSAVNSYGTESETSNEECGSGS